MLHTVTELAQSSERMFGLIYTAMARLYEEGTPQNQVLSKIADEEFFHAAVMERLKEHLPDDYEGYSYEDMYVMQAAQLNECTRVLLRINLLDKDSDDEDKAALLRVLTALEKTLSDSLFTHFRFFKNEECRVSVDKMATQSMEHAGLLESLLINEMN